MKVQETARARRREIVQRALAAGRALHVQAEQARRRRIVARALALGCALAALGCASTDNVAVPGEPQGRDTRLALARSVAQRGVPSPTPQLDALAEAVARTTPTLGLRELLGAHADRLRVGDQLQLTIVSLPELSGPRAIGNDGKIEGPVGLLKAEGLTAAELEGEVKKALAATYTTQKVVHEVSVRVLERAPRSVEIVGRVGAHANGAVAAGAAGGTAPGMTTVVPLPTDRALSAYELVSVAQGLAPDADGDRLLLLRRQGDGKNAVYHLKHRDLVDAHLAGREAWLEAEDQLIVPRLPDVFVYGEVLSPGRYTWRPGLTVASLLVIAGNTTPVADPSGALLLGRDTSQDAAPDMPITANQVLFVPQVQRCYVVGPGVTNNGPLILPPTGLSVVQAISEAGWFTQFADPGEVQILRSESGRRVSIDVDVDDILDGDLDERDFMLRPGDTVMVPEGIW
jgi:polysaccharide biosynthesis/export protein